MTREELKKQLTSIDLELAEVGKGLSASQYATGDTLPVWWTNQNAMTMSASVLAFGFVVLLLVTLLLIRRPRRAEGEMLLRVFGTIVVIFGALFLVVAGYTDQQMAPVMGLLGTVVGYLLGKTGDKEISGHQGSAEKGVP